MKKLFVLVLVFVFSLFMITCKFLVENDENKENGENYKISKIFWAQDISNSRFYQTTAQMLAENSRCEVWVENGSGVTEATAKNIANEYANNVYVKMMNTFGYTIDDPDLGKVNTMEIAHYLPTGKTTGAKLTILLLDIKDGFKKEGDPYVGGYFYAVDLFKNDPMYPDIKSNELDMIYIDTYPSDPESESSYETLAHEMQHLMNFVSSYLFRYDEKNETLSLMDTWVDEGLSAAAQWVYSGQHSRDRWEYYINDPSKLIAKGNNFYIWNNRGNESTYANLDDYATVYLFFQYLRLQSGKPDEIYFEIQTSEFPDYQAVTKAKDIYSSHKNNWPLLLRDWHAANYTNSASGLYGYKNDPTLKDIKAPMFSGGTTVSLYPGEGVYSKTNTAESVPATSGNIKYSGLGSSGSTPNDTTGFANGARLTYNVDTNTEGSSATGSTTGIAANTGISLTGGRSSLQIGLDKFTGSFKVDAGYFRKNGNAGILDKKITSIFNKGRSVNKDNDNTMHRFDTSTVERVFLNE